MWVFTEHPSPRFLHYFKRHKPHCSGFVCSRPSDTRVGYLCPVLCMTCSFCQFCCLQNKHSNGHITMPAQHCGMGSSTQSKGLTAYIASDTSQMLLLLRASSHKSLHQQPKNYARNLHPMSHQDHTADTAAIPSSCPLVWPETCPCCRENTT